MLLCNYMQIAITLERNLQMSANLQYYKTFYYVAKYRNLTKAAKALYVSQPTVTHTIHCLEEELGCSLFVRSKSGMQLTPEGRLIYDHIAVAYEHILEAEMMLRQLQELSSGYLKIGASEISIHHYLLPVLTAFHKRYPDIRINISNSTTPRELQALKDNLLDFAILVISSDHKDKDLTITKLTGFRDILIAGNQFAALKKQTWDLSSLSAFPFVSVSEDTNTRQFLNTIFLQAGLTFQPDIELATTDLITPMVANNLGIGFVPEKFAQSALMRGEVFQVALDRPLPEREICLVRKSDTALSPAGQAFLCSII